MIITIVNERMLDMLGRDASVIGKSFYEIQPELAIELDERLKRVYTTGETYYQAEEKLELKRYEKPYTGYYSSTYQAIRDRTGAVYGIMVTAWELTEQVRIRRKIEEEKERTNIAIAAGELGVFEVDLLTDEIVADERFNQIYGFEKTMTRKDYIATCHPDDLEVRRTALEAGIDNGGFEYEPRFLSDTTPRWIKSKGHILYDHNRKPVKLFGVVQDTTKQRLFSESLARQVEERTLELHRSNEDLMQFAHVTSHDLKEPVRKVKTFTGRLQDEFGNVLPEKAGVYIEKIRNATDRMFSMIDGVLSYSTLNSSEQQNEPVDLNSVLDNIEADLEVMMHQKKAVLQRGKLPVVEGSAVLIYQLFYNLINNSLKFSKADVPARITVESAKIVFNGEPAARIRIEDNGIGIEPEYTERIFNAFTRLNSKDMYEGTGLGLALCKKITERHHGSIAAEGNRDAGAVFIIVLPDKQFTKII